MPPNTRPARQSHVSPLPYLLLLLLRLQLVQQLPLPRGQAGHVGLGERSAVAMLKSCCGGHLLAAWWRLCGCPTVVGPGTRAPQDQQQLVAWGAA